MKQLLKTILVMTVILSGCSSRSLKEGEAIGESIVNIVATNKLDSLPAIIKSYNALEDSLNLNNNTLITEVNKGIIKVTADKNDTIRFCARIIMNTPEGLGSWLAEQNVNKIVGSNHSETKSLLSDINIINFLYNKTGEPSSINEFQSAYNAHIDSLPSDKKAIVYARTLKPAILAGGMAEELEKAANQKNTEWIKETLNIIEGIKKEYSSNKENFNKFNNTLNSALVIMPDSIIQTINPLIKEKTK